MLNNLHDLNFLCELVLMFTKGIQIYIGSTFQDEVLFNGTSVIGKGSPKMAAF